MVLLPDGGQLGLIDLEDAVLDARHIDYFLQRTARYGDADMSHSGLKGERCRNIHVLLKALIESRKELML